MNARNGYDATASRSRGAVGKSICGFPWGKAAKSDSGVDPAIMLPAASVETISRNDRRLSEVIVFAKRLVAQNSVGDCTRSLKDTHLQESELRQRNEVTAAIEPAMGTATPCPCRHWIRSG